MSKWEEKRFEDLYEIPSRNGLTRPSSVRGEGYNFINMGELFTNNRIYDMETELVKLNDKEKRDSTLAEGDLLFARQSLVYEGAGKCSVVMNLKNVTSFESHLIRVRLNKSIAEPLFYYYYFSLPYNAVKTIVQQCAQAGIRGTDLAKIKVPYPDLPTQKRIADVLSAYDDLIENNNKRIALLEKAAQELYKEWFIRFRFPGHEKAKFINGLPEGWEVIKVKNLVKRLPFGKLYKENDVNKEGKVIVIDQSRSEYIGFHNDKPSHVASVEKPIILFGDHSCKFQLMITPFSLSENVVPFIGKDDILSAYLYYLVKDLIETTEYKRHWTELGSKKVLVADSKLQNLFVENIGDNLILIEKLKFQNRNLVKQRDLLLPRFMSGKLEV